jgi:RNA polymerase sigma-70 factor, ECF subfamily
MEGGTYGGWYRLLPDGRMELLALATMHSEVRPENTPLDQARGMLTDLISSTRLKRKMNGAAERIADARDTSGTLGAILYADPSKERISEQHWAKLVRSIATGNQLALHRLFESAHRIVFTLIVRLTHSRQAAEELTVDVFHDIWRQASKYHVADGPVLGWIMNQARRRASDWLGMEQGNTGPQSRTATAVASGPRGPVSNAERLTNALITLSAEERQTIETAFFSPMSYVGVAAQLRQPVATVQTQIHSGLGKLRHALAGVET